MDSLQTRPSISAFWPALVTQPFSPIPIFINAFQVALRPNSPTMSPELAKPHVPTSQSAPKSTDTWQTHTSENVFWSVTTKSYLSLTSPTTSAPNNAQLATTLTIILKSVYSPVPMCPTIPSRITIPGYVWMSVFLDHSDTRSLSTVFRIVGGRTSQTQPPGPALNFVLKATFLIISPPPVERRAQQTHMLTQSPIVA